MKEVIDVNAVAIIEVPVNYMQCSVCGVWHAPEQYRRPGQEQQSRTNCESCSNMDWDAMQKLKEATEQKQSSYKVRALVDSVRRGHMYEHCSVSVEDMVAALQKLPAGSRLVITEEGYYSTSELADIHEPVKIAGVENYYSIGHSCQHY